MLKRIGFVILSHNNPQQVLRLVRCLQRLYDNPPIVCHHDFDQCPLRRDDFPSNVRFVSPNVKTRWAQFSIVAAALKAIELLYKNAAPEWFTILSGADYPTLQAEKVLEDLALSKMDALIDFREVNMPLNLPCQEPENPALRHYVSPGNLALAWNRYVGLNAWLPTIRRGPRIGRHTLYLPIEVWRWRFGSKFKCYYGDFWFTGNHKVADILVNPTDEHIKLRHHLRYRVVPDECYFQSVLANIASLKISAATKRFAEWQGGGAHPKFLGVDDLSAIIASQAHFARKFSPHAPVLDAIDSML